MDEEDQVSRLSPDQRPGDEAGELDRAERVVGAETERLAEPAPVKGEPWRAQLVQPVARLIVVGDPVECRQNADKRARDQAGDAEGAAVVEERPGEDRDAEERGSGVDLSGHGGHRGEQERAEPVAAVPPAAQHRHDEERKDARRPDLAFVNHRQRVHCPERQRPQPGFALASRDRENDKAEESEERRDIEDLHGLCEVGRRFRPEDQAEEDEDPDAHARIGPADAHLHPVRRPRAAVEDGDDMVEGELLVAVILDDPWEHQAKHDPGRKRESENDEPAGADRAFLGGAAAPPRAAGRGHRPPPGQWSRR